MKRAFDILAVLVCAPLWLTVLAVTALAVFVIEGRPVFFTQLRAGLREKPFRLVKFRTMKTGPGDDAARLTRFGRFLRATSLDEVPELFHVLAGTMSLVGPRPLPVAYLPRYSAEERRRHDVRPGITGWAQVNGRNETSWADRLARDVWYVDHRTFALDLRILYLTVAVVFAARGVSKSGEATMDEFHGTAAKNNTETK